MVNGYEILDADAHVVEPFDMWQNYLEAGFKEQAPYTDEVPWSELWQSVAEVGWKGALFRKLVKHVKFDGREIYHKVSPKVFEDSTWKMIKNYTESALANFDPEAQVKAMKKMGVSMSFLYPTVGTWLLAIDTMDPKLAGALTRAYNNWLRDFCGYEPKLLRGVGAINLHDPDDMMPELRRIAGFGWKAVFLRPNPVKGRLLSDPAYEPFWSECERLGISVSVHEGTHCRLPTTGADRFNTRFALHACSHPMEQMMAFLALLEGGVLERHPRLKVAFLEAGCGWLPYWLWRLDELEYKNLAWEVSDTVKMKPSEYFRRQCFVSCEPDEPYIQDLIKYIGEDRLLFGSDYPHPDHHPDIVDEILHLEDRLPKRTVQKILWDNPVHYYGLDS